MALQIGNKKGLGSSTAPTAKEATSTPTMLQLRKAMKDAQSIQSNTILLYGPPKAGKTGLAGTTASLPHIKRVLFFDTANESSTLLNPDLGLTDADLDKIQLIPVKDCKSSPMAIETLLKYFSCQNDSISICDKHGKAECKTCAKVPEALEYTVPAVHTLTATDAIVIDSLSQVSISALWAGMELAERDERSTGKANAFAKYSYQGELLMDLLTMIQNTRNVLIVCTSHATEVNEEDKAKVTMTVPQLGTANFSRNTSGKHFSTVVFMNIETKKFKAYSTPTAKLNTVASSRLGCKVELIKDRPITMKDIITVREG